jgi:hypothetical protein
MSDKRQKNRLQMLLAFTEEGRSEAPRSPREGTESFTANGETESPARTEQLMEEVGGRENCRLQQEMWERISPTALSTNTMRR